MDDVVRFCWHGGLIAVAVIVVVLTFMRTRERSVPERALMTLGFFGVFLTILVLGRADMPAPCILASAVPFGVVAMLDHLRRRRRG